MKYIVQILRLVTTDGIIAIGLVTALLWSIILGSGTQEITGLIVSGLIGYMGRASFRKITPEIRQEEREAEGNGTSENH